jgi:hypothetical protein
LGGGFRARTGAGSEGEAEGGEKEGLLHDGRRGPFDVSLVRGAVTGGGAAGREAAGLLGLGQALAGGGGAPTGCFLGIAGLGIGARAFVFIGLLGSKLHSRVFCICGGHIYDFERSSAASL